VLLCCFETSDCDALVSSQQLCHVDAVSVQEYTNNISFRRRACCVAASESLEHSSSRTVKAMQCLLHAVRSVALPAQAYLRLTAGLHILLPLLLVQVTSTAQSKQSYLFIAFGCIAFRGASGHGYSTTDGCALLICTHFLLYTLRAPHTQHT
jgi:hypothetical protein